MALALDGFQIGARVLGCGYRGLPNFNVLQMTDSDHEHSILISRMWANA